jgi:hypothetical protein
VPPAQAPDCHRLPGRSRTPAGKGSVEADLHSSGPAVPCDDGGVRAAAADPVSAPSRRITFPARRPTALVVPLALVTEAGGALMLAVLRAPIGWFVVAAPVGALLVTGLLFRPRLELTREGIRLRQYPFSSTARWEAIEAVGLTRAGNRVILGYRLAPGIPPPRHQPAAALLRAASRPYDGGFFVDSLAGRPEEVLEVVSAHLADPVLRSSLPTTRRS